jgi:hypothetical protein
MISQLVIEEFRIPQQLYWTSWGASSAQKEQPRPEPKDR